MRLKTYVDFGLLTIGQQLYISDRKQNYVMSIIHDPMYPADDNILLEIVYKDQTFASNNLKNIVKRFEANGFKLSAKSLVENYFYIDLEMTTTLRSMTQKIIKIVCKEHGVLNYGYGKSGSIVELRDWTTDLEQMRLDFWNIIHLRITEIYIHNPKIKLGLV